MHIYIHTLYPYCDWHQSCSWCVSPLGHSQMSNAWGTGGRHTQTHTYVHTCSCTHTCRHAGRQGTGQPIRPPQVPSRPLNRALMGCGIDIPSVTVSRWITVNGRGTQKSAEEARGRGDEEREGARGGGGDRGIKPAPPSREPLSVFLSETPPYPGRKDLIPNTPSPSPNLPSPFFSSWSSSCCPCFSSLSLSLPLCLTLLRDSGVSAVRLCVPPGNLPKRLICTTWGAQRPWGLRATELAMYQDVSSVGVAIPVLSHHD